MRRIIKRAGIEVWPKTFQNLRSTRETELFRETNGNIKAVCSWIGNSPEVAMRHYAQVTQDDFDAVIESGTLSGTLKAQNPAQQLRASFRNEMKKFIASEGIEATYGVLFELLRRKSNHRNNSLDGRYWT